MTVKPLIYDAKQDLGWPSVWAQRLATSLAPATLLQGSGKLDATCLERSSEQYFTNVVLPPDGACT